MLTCRLLVGVHWLWLIWLMPVMAYGQLQPLPCDDSYYVFLVPHSNASTSEMYRMRLDAAGMPMYELVNADVGYRVTAAGYSVVDQYIYALDYNTKELLRIGAGGEVTVLGVPPNLNVDYEYLAGDTSPSGQRLHVVGHNTETGADETFFSIRLHTPDFTAGRVSLLSNYKPSLEDLAFDPFRGVLYGYDDTENKLVTLDPFSGQLFNHSFRSMNGVGRLGSLFFDTGGNLQAYGSSGGAEEGVFYNVNKLRGESERISDGPKGRFSDGCACPYRISTFKTVEPQRAFPCSEVTFQYTLVNHGGTAYSFIQFSDTLPSGLVITEIVEQPQTSTVTSGVGNNVLTLEEVDLILDTTIIIIKAEVQEDALPGSFASYGYMQELTQALGSIIRTDDPTTPAKLDPTTFEIAGGNDLQLDSQQRFDCNGGGITLSIGIRDAKYQWSTGDTTANLVVQMAGEYAVTVTTDCGVYADTVLVPEIPQLLTLAFDANLQVDAGQQLDVIPRLTTTRPLSYNWQSEETLACVDCPTLSVQPFKNTVYSLTISDEYACSLQDSVAVQVRPVRHLYFPDVFSPNNDGRNDTFYLQGMEGSATVRNLQIFDRWGAVLFEQNDIPLNASQEGWDGRSGGEQMEAGLYVWVAELAFPDGTTERFSGKVILVQ